MIIRSIHVCNFGLYAGEQVIEPASSNTGQGVITLIGGLNGQGKTSLLEAVLLNLYGNRSPAIDRTMGYTAYLANLIHRGVKPEEGSWVRLTLEVPDEDGSGTELAILRSWRVANVRASEKLQIWRDGVEDPYLAANWSSYVEDLIPSGVSGLFFFDGEKIKTLAEEDETNESLRVAMRSLLGLELVDELIADLNSVIRRHRSEVRHSADDSRITELESQDEQLRNDLQKVNEELVESQEQTLKARHELQVKEEQYLRAGGSLAETRSGLEQQHQRLLERMAACRAEINQLAMGSFPLLMLTPLLEQVASGVQASAAVDQARLLLPLIEQRNDRLIEFLSRSLSPATLNRVNEFLQADRDDLASQTVLNSRLRLSAIGQGQLAALLDDHKTVVSRAHDLVRLYGELKIALDQVEGYLQFQYDEELVTESLARLSDAARQLATCEEKERLLRARSTDLENLILQVNAELQVARDHYFRQLEVTDDAIRTIEIARRSQVTLREFGTRVTERKVQTLEASVLQAFNELTYKDSLASTIRIDPVTLNLTLLDDRGRQVPKSRLSSGEKQMLAIAILWGLAAASGRNLPVIIDTPLSRLDSSHRMNFITRYLPQASHQVMVLSTDTEVVGQYVQALGGAVGKTYLLRYDDIQERTQIEPGYFSAEEAAG